MLPLAITMGCPAGIGPEIILKHFSQRPHTPQTPVVVAGDRNVLDFYASLLNIECSTVPWLPGNPLPEDSTIIPVYESSTLAKKNIHTGIFSKETAIAMADAITSAVKGILDSHFSGLCTCPISKEALQKSGYHFPGHTEMLADLTAQTNPVMMLAGSSLRVTLATIHCALRDVPGLLNCDDLIELYKTTHKSLMEDFDIASPKIAVAALNPHAGEGGMFGNEEDTIILPSIKSAQKEGLDLHGPFPPDTIFAKAAQGEFDAVVCMYHDQGLIPFKLLHFKDGVNITLGLPIVRTSVDHGTAYDIAGNGIADPASLNAAITLAHTIISNRSISNRSLTRDV